jgi:WD40 repeat protein
MSSSSSDGGPFPPDAALAAAALAAPSSSPSPSSSGPAGAGVMHTTDAPQIIEHLTKSLNFTPTDVRWIPVSSRFVVLGSHPRGTGAVVVHEMGPKEVKVVREMEYPVGIKCSTFGASFLEDRHLAVGDMGGNVAILNLDTGSATKPVWSVRAHTSMVNCIDGIGGLSIGNGAPELATGGRDGTVKIWDPRISDPVVSLEPAEAGGAAGGGAGGRECWTVCFGNSYSDEERCLAAGYDNGDVKLFDLRMNAVRWETNVGNGVVSVDFDRRDIEMNKLVATTLESKFRVFDMRTQHPTRGFSSLTEKAHKATVWLARHLPQNRDVWLTSGGNGGLNLYRYHYPAKRADRDPEGKPVGIMGKCELVNARCVRRLGAFGGGGGGGDSHTHTPPLSPTRLSPLLSLSLLPRAASSRPSPSSASTGARTWKASRPPCASTRPSASSSSPNSTSSREGAGGESNARTLRCTEKRRASRPRSSPFPSRLHPRPAPEVVRGGRAGGGPRTPAPLVVVGPNRCAVAWTEAPPPVP